MQSSPDTIDALLQETFGTADLAVAVRRVAPPPKEYPVIPQDLWDHLQLRVPFQQPDGTTQTTLVPLNEITLNSAVIGVPDVANVDLPSLRLEQLVQFAAMCSAYHTWAAEHAVMLAGARDKIAEAARVLQARLELVDVGVVSARDRKTRASVDPKVLCLRQAAMEYGEQINGLHAVAQGFDNHARLASRDLTRRTATMATGPTQGGGARRDYKGVSPVKPRGSFPRRS